MKQISSSCVIIFFICAFIPNRIHLISLKFDISKIRFLFLKQDAYVFYDHHKDYAQVVSYKLIVF